METTYMDSETVLPRYYPLPQFLLDLNISSTAKILYALLLNRANLSQKNSWQDEQGQVYCVYTIEELAADMNKGQTAIKNSLNELGKLGLLERVRAKFGRANHLYIKIPKGVETVAKPPAIESENRQSVGYCVRIIQSLDSPQVSIYEGQHEAIISEEEWNLAQLKRKKNAFKREKVNDPDHAHILSGILKCLCCGKSLYGNIAKAHSKDKKTRYYYYCKNTVNATGHKCTFRVNIEQTEMNRMVAAIISAMVNKPVFVNAIKEKIGIAIDTENMEKELETLYSQLRQISGTKKRLEKQEDGCWIKNITFNFPVPLEGKEVTELCLEKETTLETICLLSKLNVNHHIEVELNLDELDLTDVEKKATYEEIKAYVLENTGLKVSNLYIAQVKQKYDIIERENYNKPKSENARQPQCPPEKEKAIKDALKHFAMI